MMSCSTAPQNRTNPTREKKQFSTATNQCNSIGTAVEDIDLYIYIIKSNVKKHRQLDDGE